jgi:tetraprenyl-beta-curcumene synthase
VAAAAGSSLAIHALIAAAAAPQLQAQDVAAIEAAYFPSIGALHSLLDSLVDQAEDAEAGQLRLLDCYPSRRQAAEGLERLAKDSLAAARELPGPAHQHELLLIAMACSYLSAPEASAVGADAVKQAVRASLGSPAGAMLRVFALRRLARSPRSTQGVVATAGSATSVVGVDTKSRGVDARVA